MTQIVLSRFRNWIFDLDDTLYPSSQEVYNQMADRIRTYLMNLLHISAEDAWTIQKDYYIRYGATARGLMLEHRINPKDFVDDIHQLDLTPLKPDARLKEELKKLPGNRFIFTNGANIHARRVLKQLELTDLFSGIFSINEANYLPKPAPETYHNMLRFFDISPEQSIMFDDNQKNLLTAHQLGLTTVWISSNTRDNIYNSITDAPDFCDYHTSSVCSFLSTAIF